MIGIDMPASGSQKDGHMLRTGLFLGIIAFSIAATAFSEEPARREDARKQRVSPKLLREAMLLPFPKPEAIAPPSLEDLKRLSERLRVTGNNADADLLQRFTHEHQRLVNQSAWVASASDQRLEIRCEVIEVNLDALAENSRIDSIAGGLAPSDPSHTEAIRKELRRLVSEKKARVRYQHCFKQKIGEASHYESGGEVAHKIPAEKGRPDDEWLDLGIVLDVLPTMVSQDRVKVQLSCDSAEPEANAVEGDKHAAESKRMFQNTFEMNVGSTAIFSLNSPAATETPVKLATSRGHGLFLLTSTVFRK
jgi:hypothetical protein